ncbi:GWxTD domain-containing protein [Rudanella lutea]|uniref:GWxTD domain-containing protein n=1 Tax=Rudanella lutea TaxID=451374 RepID=UPI000484ED75|nr:GWxTD domain-containing protein [Rudanella lutea]
MRLLSAITLTLLVSACASSKKTQPTAYDSNRSNPSRTEAPNQSREMADRPRTPGTLNADPGAAAPGASARPAGSSNARPTTPAAGTPPASGGNSAPDYAVTAIKGKFLTVDSTATRVYLHIYTRQPDGKPIRNIDDFATRFLVNYVLYPDYNNRERLGYGNVPTNAQTLTVLDDYLVLNFEVKRPKDAVSAIMLTEITEVNSGRKALNDLQIRFQAPRITDRFTLFDAQGRLPRLRNFVSRNDTVVIRDVNGTSKPLYGFRYKHEFDAASSPMNTGNRPVPKTLAVDSTLTVMTNQPFQLPREGLYFFLEDTTDTYGLGLMVTDNRFPKLTRPEKLAKPVMYVSTSSEMNELGGASDAKKALDKYWLGLMSGNEEVARRTIRAYYNRVEEANRLFTTYKEGWKTDKGMIYIVLGPPDRVQRSRDREVWVYNRRANVSEINFTFNRKPNQFVDDHYELVRFAEYQPVWYPIVEAWRTGAIRE